MSVPTTSSSSTIRSTWAIGMHAGVAPTTTNSSECIQRPRIGCFHARCCTFEGFEPANARAVLDTYSPDYCVFNDDVQGTGAVLMAALYAGLKVTGIPTKDQSVVVFG